MFPIGAPSLIGDPTGILAFHYWFQRALVEVAPEQQDSALLAHIYVLSGMLKDPATRSALQSATASLLTKAASPEPPPAEVPALQPSVGASVVADTPVLEGPGDQFTVRWGAGPMPEEGGALMVNVFGPFTPEGGPTPDMTQAGSTPALMFPENTPLDAGDNSGEFQVLRGEDPMAVGLYKLALTVRTFLGDERYLIFEVAG